MSIRLQVENYRVLRKIDWELPKGVCALVGPNGSGKTTLLDVPAMLGDFLKLGLHKGFDRHGTLDGLRNLLAGETEHVSIGVTADAIQWVVGMSWTTYNLWPAIDESVLHDDELISARSSQKGHDFVYANLADESTRRDAADRSALVMALRTQDARLLDGGISELSTRLTEYRLYPPYELDGVRKDASPASPDVALDVDGRNVFSVLRNWQGKRSDVDRYDFVIDGLLEAFPDVFEHLDFESTDKTVTGRIIMPGVTQSLPIRYAPSGLLTALLHLTAVASTPQGGIVAIDEPENGLHPYAIKRILKAMREWADEKDLTVLLASHSPMLLDQFKGEPEHLFVMEPGHDALPIRLDQVRDREWLAQFSLGDLYKAGDFGAPAEGAGASV